MESLVNGMAFLLEFAREPEFKYKQSEGIVTLDDKEHKFPKLLVSIGSGVSIIKVDDFNKY